MQKLIKEYILERRSRQRIGVMVGFIYQGMIVAGWSKTALSLGDTYDADEGLRLATARAKGEEPTPQIPESEAEQWKVFKVRCLKYFKDASVMSVQGPFVAPKLSQTGLFPTSDPLAKILDMYNQLFGTLPSGINDVLSQNGFADELEALGIDLGANVEHVNLGPGMGGVVISGDGPLPPELAALADVFSGKLTR